MGKTTVAQIREECRKEFAKVYKAKYEDKIKNLEESLSKYKQLYSEVSVKCQIATEENMELKDQCDKYADWISRLQEYMDMDPEARQVAIQRLYADKEISEKLNGLLDVYSRFTNMLFI